MRRYSATAGDALVGASLLTAAPAAPAALPTPPALRVASADVRLAAAASLLNIPVNLITDLVNVPYNEVQAVDFLSKSLFFSGPWWVVSATNLWGVDPGDPSHFRSVVNFLVPFPALSGLDLGQNDPNGLGQQLWQTAAALLPVSGTCDSHGCLPNVPTSPITGIAGVDSLLWYAAIATGQQQLPIFNTWFQPGPLAALASGYPFSTSPGIIDPDGKVFPLFGIPGTDGPQNLMPWHDVTFQLDPIRPFVAYFNHLMADPADNPIQLPSLVEVGRSVQALLASLVMVFDPFTPGSPSCAGDCSFVTDQHLDIPDIVRSIGKLWPGNDTIDTWLAAYDSGTANVPTQEIIDRSVKILQQGFWSFGNPSPPAELSTGFNLSTLAPIFHKMWTDLGFNPPPLNTDVEGGDDNTSPVGPSTALREIGKVPQPTVPPAVSAGPADPAGTAGSSGSVLNVAVNPPADVPGSGAATPPAQGGGLTPPTPSNDTVRKPGFVPRLVNRLLPHPSDANTTTTDTKTPDSGTEKPASGTEKPGSGTEKPGAGTEKPDPDTKTRGPGTNKRHPDTNKKGSGSGTSTGAHSGGGRAA